MDNPILKMSKRYERLTKDEPNNVVKGDLASNYNHTVQIRHRKRNKHSTGYKKEKGEMLKKSNKF